MGVLDISVAFPHIGIHFDDLGKSVSVFGLSIAYYGIIIALGIFAGYFVAQLQAKRTGQSADLYLDFAMYLIIISILGARAYYVLFSWDYYKDNPIQILNFRAGGLAIYGGIIAGFITTIVFSKLKKVSFFEMGDTVVAGLAIGQCIGRWGNFFNREAFGSYTDCLFAMQLKTTEVSQTVLKNNPEYLEHLVTIGDQKYIQVHPTFLYESVGCLIIALFVLAHTGFKKRHGQLMGIYFIGYGLLRFFIEGMRTDQLLLWNTSIPVSRLVSLIALTGGIILEIICFYSIRKDKIKDKE